MIKKHLLALLVLFIGANVYAQTYTREQVKKSLKEDPSFTIHQDNYLITGIPTNTAIKSNTADIKYQISFKQLISRDPLFWDSYLYLTYTQKAFWNIYEFSSPFQEINFNPTIGLSKVFYDDTNHAKGVASLMLNHESNGRDSTASRSWNRLSAKYATALTAKTTVSLEVWAPFGYQEDNPDLLEYVGLGELRVAHEFIPNRLSFETALRKGLNLEWKGAVRTRLYYNPFKSNNQYIMLEWYAGQAESLIAYEKFTSMVRLGFVIKTNELDFLKPKPE
ncbi:phospholipase A [Formosa sediminum]|uniref:Phosphatidylcholine 1-acylhydrolase n=1 Tax=Formosa sediminum TaxID=2594004 RepID=A0A516GTS8_9FLAO|nr:phospholipase A [Formosa sediminum]QDO94929.1 phospholipase A [Formosa sediminum]